MEDFVKEYEYREIETLTTDEAIEKYGKDVLGKKITLILTKDLIERIHRLMWYTTGCGHDYGMANHELTIAILDAVKENKDVIFVAEKKDGPVV